MNYMQDMEEQIKSATEMLEEGLAEVFSTGHFHRFLAFIAGNPNYSYRNVILILQQCPHASVIRGFRSWIKHGRMVKSGERGLRINACFDKDEQEPKPPKAPQKKKHRQSRQQGDSSSFRRISVFDISQTAAMVDGNECQEAQWAAPPGANAFAVAPLDGSVAEYESLIEDLSEVSPIPIVFMENGNVDSGGYYDSIIIDSGMSRLHTICAIANQIAGAWLRGACADKEQLEIMAESVAFIVCQHLGLDSSDFSFRHIAGYSINMERAMLEKFLDDIQKTALYFIDTLDGVREARSIGYQTDEFFLFTNRKTAFSRLRQGHYVYLVYPGEGELLVMDKKDLEQYDGPFAMPRDDWFGDGRMAA